MIRAPPHRLRAGGQNYGWGPTVIGTLVSFAIGLVVIYCLLKWVSTRTFGPFVVYRVALGALVLVLLGAGAITADVAMT